MGFWLRACLLSRLSGPLWWTVFRNGLLLVSLSASSRLRLLWPIVLSRPSGLWALLRNTSRWRPLLGGSRMVVSNGSARLNVRLLWRGGPSLVRTFGSGGSRALSTAGGTLLRPGVPRPLSWL